MNDKCYNVVEFLAVARTIGFMPVAQTAPMGGLSFAGNANDVYYVRGWKECATPEDVEKLLASYPLYRKNTAAAAMGRIGGAVKSARKAAASRANGKKGGRPPKAAK